MNCWCITWTSSFFSFSFYFTSLLRLLLFLHSTRHHWIAVTVLWAVATCSENSSGHNVYSYVKYHQNHKVTCLVYCSTYFSVSERCQRYWTWLLKAFCIKDRSMSRHTLTMHTWLNSSCLKQQLLKQVQWGIHVGIHRYSKTVVQLWWGVFSLSYQLCAFYSNHS